MNVIYQNIGVTLYIVQPCVANYLVRTLYQQTNNTEWTRIQLTS